MCRLIRDIFDGMAQIMTSEPRHRVTRVSLVDAIDHALAMNDYDTVAQICGVADAVPAPQQNKP